MKLSITVENDTTATVTDLLGNETDMLLSEIELLDSLVYVESRVWSKRTYNQPDEQIPG